jgi:hypothetical protein
MFVTGASAAESPATYRREEVGLLKVLLLALILVPPWAQQQQE